MGLDTTHDCWHGSYGSFNRWRQAVARCSGLGNLDEYVGFDGEKPWPEGKPIVKLLHHSDCDGELAHEDCGPIADALESVLPALDVEGFKERTQQFIKGLRLAAKQKENVNFR